MDVSGQLHPQGKSPWYPLNRRLDVPQSRSGRGGEEKDFRPLPGLELPLIQPIAQRCTSVGPKINPVGNFIVGLKYEI